MSRSRARVLDDRACGVLLHPSSLRNHDPIGDIGPAAHEFVEWCADAGCRWWQMLPVGPVGAGDSPYASPSSFAGEPLLLSLDTLRDDGLLSAHELRESRRVAARAGGTRGDADPALARIAKEPALLAAFEAFRLGGGFDSASFRAFGRRASAWLPGWRAFTRDTLGYHAFVQFQFERQWSALRACCRTRGVRLLGDLPIFVSLDSADVQSDPRLFRLNRMGRPQVVTGCPPDCFSRDGQRWGHPHYRWSAHARDGYRWWTSRIAHSLERFDALRIDHFVGFHHAYEIPATERTARRGAWRPQRGREVLAAARAALGPLPLVAEDLGAVTPEVVALRRDFGLPGMQVLQHAFGCDNSSSLPHRHARESVVYTGTHDNDTSIGWANGLDSATRRRFAAYAGADAARDPAWALSRLALSSPSALAIIPMQDVLRLGSGARMNTPGTPKGNWRWRLPSRWRASATRAGRQLRDLAAITGRIG